MRFLYHYFYIYIKIKTSFSNQCHRLYMFHLYGQYPGDHPACSSIRKKNALTHSYEQNSFSLYRSRYCFGVICIYRLNAFPKWLWEWKQT